MNFGAVLTTSKRGWVGNGSLWVQFEAGSELTVLPPGPHGFLSGKLGWFRAVPGQVLVSGRPVTGPAANFRSDVGTVPEYGPTGFVPSVLRFERPGCWRITGHLAGTRLSFVVEVIPQAP